jgi:23S rRNA (cytosine1962-C5)-methyltransferase
MLSPDNYSLLDFGEGRKLERFGTRVLDRPAPGQSRTRRVSPELWSSADARYERSEKGRGVWHLNGDDPGGWTVDSDGVHLELRLTDSGQVGVFAEQAENWSWLAEQIRQAGRPLRVLNLFAYTGGATIAAALAGAEVSHIDSAKNVVNWAHRNAEASGLTDAPIRWIVEDAQAFVDRELRRGQGYDAVILDPPSYGHGGKGRAWKLTSQLRPLLAACGKLTAARRAFMLLTCHSTDFDTSELRAALAETVLDSREEGIQARQLLLTADDGRRLPTGVVARWPT